MFVQMWLVIGGKSVLKNIFGLIVFVSDGTSIIYQPRPYISKTNIWTLVVFVLGMRWLTVQNQQLST